eukprot:CFRG7398T1
MYASQPHSGVIAVYKPRGMASSTAVKIIKVLLHGREFRPRRKPAERIKVGHGGTLDREAQGVLVIGINKGTKMMHSMLTGVKSYRFSGVLGAETDTLDVSGKVNRIAPCDHVRAEHFNEELASEYTGKILQVAPIYSALKRGGSRLSDLQRESVNSENETSISPPPAREVVCDSLCFRATDDKLPAFDGDCTVHGGFYIRSLIRDVGVRLGSAAHATFIERIAVGRFREEKALRFEDWTAQNILRALKDNGPTYAHGYGLAFVVLHQVYCGFSYGCS